MSERSSGSTATGRRKGWRSFLTPGWIIAVLTIIAFSYAAFSFLAPWQLNKDDDIVERNERIDAAFRTDPVPVTDVFGAAGEIEPDEEWSRVILQGRYLPEDEVILRLRPVESSPAYHALTPFQLDSGETILVNRGFSVPVEGQPVIDPAPTEPVTITGHARLNEPTPPTAPMTEAGFEQVYGINTEEISAITGTDLAHDYVQLSEGQPGELRAIPVPKLDRGSHLSYGFQWIAFGIMAPIGLGYFIWAEIRERRRVRREEQELLDVPVDTTAGSGTQGDAGVDADAAVDEAPAAPARRRARYGDEQEDHYGKFARRSRERF